MAIGILGLMERPHFQRGLEAAVLIGVPRGMAHQPRRHFSILWSVPVCGLFPHTAHTGDGPAWSAALSSPNQASDDAQQRGMLFAQAKVFWLEQADCLWRV